MAVAKREVLQARLKYTRGRGRDAPALLLSAATRLDALGETGGRDIYHGALRKRAMAFSTWRTPGPDVPRIRFGAAPLAELVAVQRSTGIPNIVAGIPLSRAAGMLMRIAGPLLGKLVARQATRATKRVEPGPSPAAIAAMGSRVWAEAGDATGKRARSKGASARKSKTTDTVALEKQLTDALGLVVSIDHRGEGGVISIRYRNLDQLDDLTRRLGGKS